MRRIIILIVFLVLGLLTGCAKSKSIVWQSRVSAVTSVIYHLRDSHAYLTDAELTDIIGEPDERLSVSSFASDFTNAYVRENVMQLLHESLPAGVTQLRADHSWYTEANVADLHVYFYDEANRFDTPPHHPGVYCSYAFLIREKRVITATGLFGISRKMIDSRTGKR